MEQEMVFENLIEANPEIGNPLQSLKISTPAEPFDLESAHSIFKDTGYSNIRKLAGSSAERARDIVLT